MQENFHEFELRGWDSSASAYDTYFTPLTLKAFDKIVQNGKIGRGTRVLDVACGPGHLTHRLRTLGAEVSGIDFSESMIALAKKFYDNGPFAIGDAHALQFSENSFDAVIMNFGILHLARPEKAIGEAFRVLRRPGRFVMSVWGVPQESKGFELILNAIHETGFQPALPEGPPFFKFSDDIAADRALKDAGFAEVAIESIRADWSLPDADALFRAFFEGTARTGGLLRTMDPEALDQVRNSVAKNMAKYKTGTDFNVPMCIKIATGVKK